MNLIAVIALVILAAVVAGAALAHGVLVHAVRLTVAALARDQASQDAREVDRHRGRSTSLEVGPAVSRRMDRLQDSEPGEDS
jgi:hypothetical protein